MQRFPTTGTRPGTGTKLFFSLTIKITRPVSELVENTTFSKWDQVDDTDLVVGLGVEKVGNHCPIVSRGLTHIIVKIRLYVLSKQLVLTIQMWKIPNVLC